MGYLTVAKQCMVPVSANDYINQMADHNYGMKVNYVCSVLETKRVVAEFSLAHFSVRLVEVFLCFLLAYECK